MSRDEVDIGMAQIDHALRNFSDLLWQDHRIDDKDTLLLLAVYIRQLERRIEDLETGVVALMDLQAKRDDK
jgi:hypothetical protein